MTILLVILAVIAVYAIFVYNKMVMQRNQVKEGWSGIDVQLKRRHNLIPNLVETVQGYAGHEKSVFKEVTDLRSQVRATNDINKKGKLESALSLGLGKLIAIAENYPDLKANENFIHLQQELSQIEDQIQLARRYYNGTARDYNTTIESFPQVIIANLFGFGHFDYFEIEDDMEKEVPKVSFGQQTPEKKDQ